MVLELTSQSHLVTQSLHDDFLLSRVHCLPSESHDSGEKTLQQLLVICCQVARNCQQGIL